MNVLVTGASGFLGSHLLPLLIQNNHAVTATYQSNRPVTFAAEVKWLHLDILEENLDLEKFMHNFDMVIHLASLVHDVSQTNNHEIYEKINVAGTERLAKSAVDSGVKRFIYLSTIKVLGEKTQSDINNQDAFTEMDDVKPVDAYGISKFKAEQKLKEICDKSTMDYVIIRPPLIYGPGVKANFLRLLRLVSKNIPLPLASINNKRSLIYVKNLCDAINKCMIAKEAANQSFLISDCELSTPELVQQLARAMNKQARLFPCPNFLLRSVGFLLGKKQMVDRLTDSLLIDRSKIEKTLNWRPPVDMKVGFSETVNWYLNQTATI